MCRLLIDTNILLDAVIENRVESNEACEVLDLCNGNGELGMACALSFKDVYYITNRLYGEDLARKCVDTLMGLLTIAPVDAEVCEMAFTSGEPDFEDGIIRACAEINDADFIITRDKDAFATSKVRSVTAAEYVRIARLRDDGKRAFA